MSEDTSNENNQEMEVTRPIGEIDGMEDITEHLAEHSKQEIKLTSQEVLNVKKALAETAVLGSHVTLPMLCAGPKCPVSHTCPLQQVGKSPLGQRCPMELHFMNTLKDQLVISLGADWNDRIERQQVMDLVETEILQMRANGMLADDGFIMNNVVGLNEATGEAIEQKQIHIAFTVKDMIYKRKERLLKSLAATREMKRKLGIGGADPSSQESDILARYHKSMARDDKGVVKDAKIISSKASEKDTKTPKKKPKA